jgi:hypothetical protein
MLTNEYMVDKFEYAKELQPLGVKYFTDAGIECTPEECKLIESLNRLAKKWEKDGKRLWLYSASGVLTVMMHGDREDNPIPEMLPNAGTNPDNIITTISGIGNDGGDW